MPDHTPSQASSELGVHIVAVTRGKWPRHKKELELLPIVGGGNALAFRSMRWCCEPIACATDMATMCKASWVSRPFGDFEVLAPSCGETPS